MKAKERLLQIQEYTGMSGRALAMYIGVNDYDFKAIRVEKVKGISDKIADALVEKFPHLNKLWILTGEGEMLLNQASPASKEDNLNQKINEFLSVIHTMTEINRNQQKQIDLLLQIIHHEKKIPYTSSIMASEPNVKIK